MPDGHVFISHIKKDEASAMAIAKGLEDAGFSTWYFERDVPPGSSYLIEVDKAIERASAVVVLISPTSLGSHQMTKEIVRAHEAGKDFVPVRFDISHEEFQQRKPEWRMAIGAASSIEVPSEGVGAIVPPIVTGVRQLLRPGDSDPPKDPDREDPIWEWRGQFVRASAAALASARKSPAFGALATLVLVVAVGSALWRFNAPSSSNPADNPGTVQVAPVQATPDFGGVLLKEDFRDNKNGWPTVSEPKSRQFVVNDGRYVMSSSTVNGYTASIPVAIDEAADFQIRCRMTKRSGVSNFYFGLVWGKRDEENFFNFAIASQGTVSITRKRDGQFFNYVDPAAIDEHVNKGDSTNVLVIRKEGRRMRFFVNGYQVHEMPSEPFFGNGVGFVLYNNMEVGFEDLVVTSPYKGFHDSFDGQALDGKWRQQGIRPTVAKGSVLVSGSGSSNSLVSTKVNPFPASGHFALTMSFKYTDLKHWGQAISISDRPLPSLGESRGKYALEQAIVEIIQDSEYWDFTVFVLGKDVVHKPRNTNAHTLSVAYDGRYTVKLDQETVYDSPEPIDRRPTLLWFGEPRQEQGDWTSLRIDEIDVRPIP